eukprot:3708977-Ditylum_brightwellii.AAC.1
MMSKFQISDFTSDFEQQSAVTIQSSLWGFISQKHHLHKCKTPDYAAQCIHVSSPSSIKPLTTPTSKPMTPTVCDELILIMNKIQEDLNRDIQDMHQRQAIKFNGYLSKLSTAVASNKEHLQQHQDHDAATKIQSISRRFIH